MHCQAYSTSERMPQRPLRSSIGCVVWPELMSTQMSGWPAQDPDTTGSPIGHTDTVTESMIWRRRRVEDRTAARVLASRTGCPIWYAPAPLGRLEVRQGARKPY